MAPLDAMVSFESASVPQENLEVKEALKTVKVRFSFAMHHFWPAGIVAYS